MNFFTNHINIAKNKYIPAKKIIVLIAAKDFFFTIDVTFHSLIKYKRYCFKTYRKYNNETNRTLYCDIIL